MVAFAIAYLIVGLVTGVGLALDHACTHQPTLNDLLIYYPATVLVIVFAWPMAIKHDLSLEA